MLVSRTSNAMSTVEFPKASRLFHPLESTRAALFSAIVRGRRVGRGAAAAAATSHSTAPSAVMLQDIARDGFGRVTGARRFECVRIEAFATRSRGGIPRRLFSSVAIREKAGFARGTLAVVLPDADAGVRRAEVDPDSGAVNLGHDALTGELGGGPPACARRT